MSIEITLTHDEMLYAAQVGYARLLALHARYARERKAGDRKSLAEQWFFNVVGTQGELAAARALNVYFSGVIEYDRKLPDLPPDWQVRTLEHHHYDLNVRPEDIDHYRYVLLTGNNPFLVHGWIWGHDAKRPEWFGDRGGHTSPNFWVPQSQLYSCNPTRLLYHD